MICLIDKERLNAFLPLIPSPLYPLMKRETVFLVGAVEHGVAVGAAFLSWEKIRPIFFRLPLRPSAGGAAWAAPCCGAV